MSGLWERGRGAGARSFAGCPFCGAALAPPPVVSPPFASRAVSSPMADPIVVRAAGAAPELAKKLGRTAVVARSTMPMAIAAPASGCRTWSRGPPSRRSKRLRAPPRRRSASSLVSRKSRVRAGATRSCRVAAQMRPITPRPTPRNVGSVRSAHARRQRPRRAGRRTRMRPRADDRGRHDRRARGSGWDGSSGR